LKRGSKGFLAVSLPPASSSAEGPWNERECAAVRVQGEYAQGKRAEDQPRLITGSHAGHEKMSCVDHGCGGLLK